jgi:hypothetical protein
VLPAIPPDVHAAALERLDPDDVPVAAMALAGTSHSEIAEALATDRREVSRRIRRTVGRLGSRPRGQSATGATSHSAGHRTSSLPVASGTRGCTRDPMVALGSGHDDGSMSTQLLRIAPGAGTNGVASLPDELDAVAAALSAAAGACDNAARRILPAGDRDESICTRYDRAAHDWPATPPPSRERFAALLGLLHDAGSAARQAAARCGQARQSLDADLGRVHDPAR